MPTVYLFKEFRLWILDTFMAMNMISVGYCVGCLIVYLHQSLVQKASRLLCCQMIFVLLDQQTVDCPAVKASGMAPTHSVLGCFLKLLLVG